MKLAKLRNKDHRKASIINEMMNKIDALEACESTCHESTMKDEIKNTKNAFLLRENKIIMEKYIENKEIMRKTVVTKLKNKNCDKSQKLKL